jgi:hypothetical protein
MGYPLQKEAHIWLGRATALADRLLDDDDRKEFKRAANLIVSTFDRLVADVATYTLTTLLYRALAAAELNAPSSAQGAFIPAGNSFEALVAIGKILGEAERDVLIVDPYMDEKALTDFAPMIKEGVAVRLLADQQFRKPGLLPATLRWTEQYKNSRPLEARIAPPKSLHDRLVIVDDKVVSVLTQSLNAFAARSPATIVRVDPETASLKVAAYRELWNAASALK